MIARGFDIALASILIVLSSPLWLIAAIGIKLTSPGPLLYHADRMGKNAVPYKMTKFRTMHASEERGSEITAPADARIFVFGKLLRRTKLDELPQFINVIRGEMAMVGPRPESVAIVRDHYTDWMAETLAVLPGVTSPGAIFGYTHADAMLDDARPEQSYVEHVLAPKLAIERAYLDRRTLASDIGVIARTVATIVQIALGKRDFALPVEAAAATHWYDFSTLSRDAAP